MTKEQFIFLIETQKPFEFTYNNIVYNMTYDKNEKGENVIIFGRLYEGKKYKVLTVNVLKMSYVINVDGELKEIVVDNYERN